MTLLDLVLGDRAGGYLLLSWLLVTTLAIIAAIIDIPLRSLREAGLVGAAADRHLLSGRLVRVLGAAALVVTFIGAAAQAYLASAPLSDRPSALWWFAAANIGCVIAVVLWGLTTPLMRHWGLCLGSFGLGLAGFFLLLAAILRLDSQPTVSTAADLRRFLFPCLIGATLIAVAMCLASILALAVHVVRGATLLAAEHRRHSSMAAARVPSQPPRPTRRRQSGGSPAATPRLRRVRAGSADDHVVSTPEDGD